MFGYFCILAFFIFLVWGHLSKSNYSHFRIVLWVVTRDQLLWPVYCVPPHPIPPTLHHRKYFNYTFLQGRNFTSLNLRRLLYRWSWCTCESLLLALCMLTSFSSLSTLAWLRWSHMCEVTWGGYMALPPSWHQRCTDEAQKAETVLSAVSYIYI